MFDEGAPKQSHRLIVAIGVLAGLVMFLASFDAIVIYRSANGSERFIDHGPEWARMVGLVLIGLLITWQRGIVVSAWPLLLSSALAALVFLISIGDWYTGVKYARNDEWSANAAFYATVVASLIAAVVCFVGLARPVIERSQPVGDWHFGRPRDS